MAGVARGSDLSWGAAPHPHLPNLVIEAAPPGSGWLTRPRPLPLSLSLSHTQGTLRAEPSPSHCCHGCSRCPREARVGISTGFWGDPPHSQSIQGHTPGRSLTRSGGLWGPGRGLRSLLFPHSLWAAGPAREARGRGSVGGFARGSGGPQESCVAGNPRAASVAESWIWGFSCPELNGKAASVEATWKREGVALGSRRLSAGF